MLNLEFKNGQAPALNDVNMNAIVGAINGNENKIKDVQAQVVELVVTHGGSIVQANPEAEKEGTLNKISIDGHVFDFYQESEISDWQVSEQFTWSSEHIKSLIDEKADASIIPTLAKDIDADDDIWMYTYTDNPDDIVVSDIVIGTTNAIKKLNQNVNTLAARDSDLKASLNGLDLSNMIQAVAGRATLQSVSMTQIGNLLIVNASAKITTALTAYQTGVIQFTDAKYKPKKATYAIALKNSTPFICGINASTGEITCNHGGCAVNDILYFDFMYMM